MGAHGFSGAYDRPVRSIRWPRIPPVRAVVTESLDSRTSGNVRFALLTDFAGDLDVASRLPRSSALLVHNSRIGPGTTPVITSRDKNTTVHAIIHSKVG